jgi:hypothetical protein
VDGPEGWSGNCLATSMRVGFVSRDGIASGIDEAGYEGRVPGEGLGVEDAGKAQCSVAAKCNCCLLPGIAVAQLSPTLASSWAKHQSGEGALPARSGRPGINHH